MMISVFDIIAIGLLVLITAIIYIVRKESKQLEEIKHIAEEYLGTDEELALEILSTFKD